MYLQTVLRAEVRTLCNRHVPQAHWKTKTDRRWQCTSHTMIDIDYVLLSCSDWTEERREMRQKCKKDGGGKPQNCQAALRLEKGDADNFGLYQGHTSMTDCPEIGGGNEEKGAEEGQDMELRRGQTGRERRGGRGRRRDGEKRKRRRVVQSGTKGEQDCNQRVTGGPDNG